ncbi:hypothetical protein HHK36_004292 [Tetracentron sinense]|uniref:BRCT domain-containing protein n=1 Tax=Tetracentron sinense TaxID=13715 RepID=A0A834ZPR6_TETSI|nr:hypothetical protein HHK36_004292 [Tetracentron sinense]
MGETAKMMTKSFKGANIFMSRNLVPPEIFDTLHDALKQNGAEVFLCCDPSRTASNDYHVISSFEHEKFEDLRAKGCNLLGSELHLSEWGCCLLKWRLNQMSHLDVLSVCYAVSIYWKVTVDLMLGPQCVLSCAKEHRSLPKEGFTCCLAMDGVKVLASGFEQDEKVLFMCHVCGSKSGLHLVYSFAHSQARMHDAIMCFETLLARIILFLGRSLITISLCSIQMNTHKDLPCLSFRSFIGSLYCDLCWTLNHSEVEGRGFPWSLFIIDSFKASWNAIVGSLMFQNICVLDILYTPEGDKYKVARRWGHIHIVTRKWFNQSIARRACLDEESYPVHGRSYISSSNTARGRSKAQHSQDKGNTSSQSVPFSVTADSNLQPIPFSVISDLDLEMTLSQNMSSTFSGAPSLTKEEGSEAPSLQPVNETKFDGCVADDSQTEDNDLYLSDCRILLVGFQASEMRKLVNMVRIGGGSRYMSFSEKLTHIVVGTPSEIEKKEVRRHAALGIIYVVRTVWLEDCDREKKEIPVSQRHIAYDLLLPKGVQTIFYKQSTGNPDTMKGKSSTAQYSMPTGQALGSMNFESGMSLEKNTEAKLETNPKGCSSAEEATKSVQQSLFAVNDKYKGPQKLQHDYTENVQDRISSNIFKGWLFRFSSNFREDQRAEVVEWVNQGGGEIVDDKIKRNVHFTIECHGPMQKPADAYQTTIVSSHWIRSCLEDGCMLDVGSHILYSPLPCRIPLPGFEGFRFSVSQYEEKDRRLLRNLCFVLGAKFTEKLSKKVTHLICKFTGGTKYEAACKWGIQSVASEWIFECVRQDAIVAPVSFCPKEFTGQDREEGLCIMSQYPTQAARMVSGDNPSQFPSQSQGMKKVPTPVIGNRSASFRDKAKHSGVSSKRARLLEDDTHGDIVPSGVHHDVPIHKMDSMRNSTSEIIGEVSHAVPDVAAAIEDLLEQTSKIQDLKLPGRTGCDQSSIFDGEIQLFSPDRSILNQDHADSHSAFGISNSWLNRSEKHDDLSNPSGGDVNRGTYDGFSETQTESQVVGYEEDLTGRQMIIDRVRTRSSLT